MSLSVWADVYVGLHFSDVGDGDICSATHRGQVGFICKWGQLFFAIFMFLSPISMQVSCA